MLNFMQIICFFIFFGIKYLSGNCFPASIAVTVILMSYIFIFLIFISINCLGEFKNLFQQNVMNKGIYFHKAQPYFIPTVDTVLSHESSQQFHFDPIGNLCIIKSGVYNFKQKTENKNEALFRVCSNNGKCLGQITFCFLTNSNKNLTNFCEFGQNGLQFQMTKNGLLHSNQKIGLVEWAGTSCALFGYMNNKIIFGPSYINFSLPSEKMEFQKLPDSTFNQFLASFNLPNGCSIEPIDSSVLIRKTSEIVKDEEAAEAGFEISDLILILYIAAGIFALFDLILLILIIIAIILEKRNAKKERKKELEERLKIQAAVIAFEARKLEREKQREQRKQKLEKEGLTKPLKHINTESEKLAIETRPQKLFVDVKEKLPYTDVEESNKKRKRRKRKNDSAAGTISEKKPSVKSIKKDATKKKTPIKSNSTQTSHVSKSETQSKQLSSAVSDAAAAAKNNDNNNNVKE